VLRLDNLSKRYGDYLVFPGLTHHFTPGCVALCEEDSTGKSTLLNLIAGAITLDSGDVWIDGHSMIHTLWDWSRIWTSALNRCRRGRGVRSL